MRDLLAEGAEVIQSAEASLRALMQTAVAERKYDLVAALAQWAEHLSQYNDDVTRSTVRTHTTHGRDFASPNGKRRRQQKRKNANRGKQKYPVFNRCRNNLVRIAWSKTAKSEYQHQSPKSVVFALFEKMQQVGKDDALITMDSVLPLSTAEQVEVPAYQSYLCLAWLRAIEVVAQHGRQGYTIVGDPMARELIEQSWLQLPALKRGAK